MWEITPNPGRIKMYTSGCPKNQNKCWNRMGSPPPVGSKKDELKFRSVSSIVIAPANTGRESRRRIAVRNTAHTNKGIDSIFMDLGFMLIIVVMKLIAPKIDEAPAKWREKIAKSTARPSWANCLERGGYTVHPVPTPVLTIEEEARRRREGGRSQNLRLFIRGKAMSGLFNISGVNQFPKAPIIRGITTKKIITKAWAVTTTL